MWEQDINYVWGQNEDVFIHARTLEWCFWSTLFRKILEDILYQNEEPQKRTWVPGNSRKYLGICKRKSQDSCSEVLKINHSSLEQEDREVQEAKRQYLGRRREKNRMAMQSHMKDQMNCTQQPMWKTKLRGIFSDKSEYLGKIRDRNIENYVNKSRQLCT